MVKKEGGEKVRSATAAAILGQATVRKDRRANGEVDNWFCVIELA